MTFSVTRTPTKSTVESFDFQKVIAPLSLDDFLAEYWERKPLIIRRNDPSYYHDLLTMADIDTVITNMALRYPAFRVVKYGENIPVESYTKTLESRQVPIPGSIDVDQVMNLYGDGATIIIQALQRYWKPLATFCNVLGKQFSARFKANIYLTPPSSQGFDTHWDTHDVLVLQIAGKKHWRIYDSPEVLPDGEERYNAGEMPLGEPTHDFVLNAGDFIYLPRGYIHEALTADEGSLHITVGIYYMLWRNVLQELLALCDGERLVREALPAGFAAQDTIPTEARMHFMALTDLLQQKLPQAMANIAESFVTSHETFRDGGLLDANNVDGIDLTTVVRARPGTLWRINVEGDQAILLTSPNKQITLPAFTEESLRFALSEESFQVGVLAGYLDDGGKLVLVRRLVREGLLEIVALQPNSSTSLSVNGHG